MLKKEYKRYLKEFTNRSARIPYRIYKKILENEYAAVEGKRSHSAGTKRSFTIGDEVPFVIHKPHNKDGDVSKWDHHNVLTWLELRGLIKNKGEKDEEEKE